jgi:hypothetical protein
MEFTKIELTILEETLIEGTEIILKDLNELQLTLVGGGNADVAFA